jgi:hypothetical protein
MRCIDILVRTILAGRKGQVLTTCPFVRWFGSASRGLEIRVVTAGERPVPSAEAKVLYVPPALSWGYIGRAVPLIVCSAKILLIVGAAVMGRPKQACILREDRACDGRGKNSNRAECFEFSHGLVSPLRGETPTLDVPFATDS